MSTELKLNLTEGVIQNAIAVALAEAFSEERRTEIIRDVVRAHLNHKERSYDKETFLSKIVGKQIREMSLECVKDQLDLFRPDLEKLISKYFQTNRLQILAQLEAALQKATVANLRVNVYFSED